ncbi:esterase FE4-like [Vanessa atalanta]|uniref:esterase FE4-like n=1 Tax=Vanessa atalanta TaxID=42275 RepID=UPI001FCCD004|nr:esterase FE4-like [Vanessa atalanta]
MKYVALLSLLLANVVKEPTPLVKVGSGLVRGRVSDNGRIYQYFGIPYATVTEKNRFQAPLPPPKWDGIFEAINENVRCPQKMFGPIILGDEDCLKLNVYTPATVSPRKPLPVMVFIHGGCFLEGTGSAFIYGPDFIVEQDVIFVGINYRLNVEGFLCLGIKEAPGNAGLKDQIAALRWIQRNIAAFGGDPNNVTLFGESAGSVSTSYLILSQAARGLFHRAILQSGATIAPWAIQHDPIKTARTIAQEFGYLGSNPHEIYKVLSTKSINELISAIKYTKRKKLVTAETLFVPCVEKDIPGVESVITKYPSEILEAGNYTKMPIIIGYNDNEGIYFTGTTHGNSIKNVNEEVNLDDIFHSDLIFPSEITKNVTVKAILDRYFSPTNDDPIMDLVDLISDVHIKYPTALESTLYAKTTDQPIYYYLFKYNGYINMPKIISGFMFKPGASHADELFYLFKPHTFPLPPRLFEMDMIKRMVTLWTNFAKYSDPTPKITSLLPVRWRPSRASNPIALIIDSRLTTAPMWDDNTMSFWNNMYTKYRRKNYGIFTPVLEISQGKLRGLRGNGQDRYLSIPYATCERFQLPKKPPKWKGILNAINPFVRCPQKMFFFTTGDEDCLYLDVFVPEWTKKSDKLPVLVFIHGGAYFKGSKELYDPEFLVIKGAIVVNINYRLGVLGFLCLNGISNLGLRDQVAALKWIQQNIALFGGDPDNVTLSGQSAGASSASLHLLSNLSKGLFHKSILMSGNAFSTWAFNVEPFSVALEDARKISAADTEEDVYDIFANALVSTLMDATYDTSVNPRYFKYSPCVDNNFTDPFFNGTPYDIVKSGKFNKVPIIVGYTDAEGGFFYRLLSNKLVKDLNENFSDRLPCVFSWCSEKERNKIGKSLRNHYFRQGSINYKTSVKGLIQYYSDWIAYGSINAFSKIMTEFSDQSVFNYQFSYDGSRDYGKLISGVVFEGTTHAGELFYIFKPLGMSLPMPENDRIMIDRFTTLILNFMKHGYV